MWEDESLLMLVLWVIGALTISVIRLAGLPIPIPESLPLLAWALLILVGPVVVGLVVGLIVLGLIRVIYCSRNNCRTVEEVRE